MRKIDVLPDYFYAFEASSKLLKLALKEAEKADYSQPGYAGAQAVLNGREGMAPIVEWFDSCLEEVRCDLKLKCEQLKTTLVWSTKTKKGAWHNLHSHHNSWASGILYLTKSKSRTWFSRASSWVDKEKTIYLNPENIEEHIIEKYPTSPGTLLIFPSHILHSVDVHDREEPRYSIAFNSFPFGNIGDLVELTQLHLPYVNQSTSYSHET